MDIFQHVRDVARVGDHHHRRTGGHAEEQPCHHAVDVEERDRHQHDLVPFIQVRHPGLDLECVRQHIAVRGNRGFGDAGCPAAVLEQRGVFGCNLQFGARGIGIFGQHILEPDVALGQPALDAKSAFLFLGEREQYFQDRWQGLFQVGHDQLLDLGLRLRGLDRLVEVGHHEHDFDARVVGLVLDLRRGIERIGGHHHAARFQDAEVGHHKLRRVRHEDPHAVALLHAHRGQRARDAICDGIHLLV